MAQDRPTIAELLEATREFLEAEALAPLTGRSAFLGRVAVNVLALIEREIALGPEADAREQARLVALLGRDGTLAELNSELARRIRGGEFDQRPQDLLAHLRETVSDKLKIANPRYLGTSRDER